MCVYRGGGGEGWRGVVANSGWQSALAANIVNLTSLFLSREQSPKNPTLQNADNIGKKAACACHYVSPPPPLLCSCPRHRSDEERGAKPADRCTGVPSGTQRVGVTAGLQASRVSLVSSVVWRILQRYTRFALTGTFRYFSS